MNICIRTITPEIAGQVQKSVKKPEKKLLLFNLKAIQLMERIRDLSENQFNYIISNQSRYE